MGGATDIIIVMIVLGGLYVLIKSGKLQEILGGNFDLQLPALPPLPGLPTPSSPSSSGDTGTGGGQTQTVSGDKIYPDANPPHACTNVSDGGLEQGGDRKEPQIACGFPFLNTEATVYINYKNIKDTLSIKLRGPKHGGGTAEKDMCNNIHYFGLGGGAAAFGKQAGHTAEYCEGGPSVSLPAGQWVGAKAVEWNEGNGVRMQSWVQIPEGSQWKLVADTVDSGNLGNCSGPAKAAYTKSPCSTGQVSIGYRVDGLKGGGDVQFKNLSVREIAPGGRRAAGAVRARRAYDTILTRT